MVGAQKNTSHCSLKEKKEIFFKGTQVEINSKN